MAAPKPPAFDTLSLHAGQQPDPATGARAAPVHETTAYVFRDCEQAASLFDLERAGHVYSRISNPTVAVLEERVAALENGVGAVATASGMAATHLAIATLLSAGDHIVASASLYGGTVNLLAQTLPRFGIETTFVPPRDHAAWRAAMRPDTKLLLGETIGNPGLDVLDIPALAKIAHDHDAPLLVDNTFATPWLARPLDMGADLVVESLTKWMGGHGVALGGALIDGGRFDWTRTTRFPTMSQPCAGFHGLVFADEFGPGAFLARARAEGLRDFGAALSPSSARALLLGLETLPLRMRQHVANAKAVLDALAAHPAVSFLSHPSLPTHPDHALAHRLLPRGAGSVVVFGVKGGRTACVRFIEALKLASHVANVGDAKTLVIHPASTTHRQMDARRLAEAGVREDMIRLSVGLEDAGDIVADLEQALRLSQK
jgi:O-acetylhomoserine (thiol)-lyase